MEPENLPPGAEGDPFHPPSISTLVHCIHCHEEYDSWRIEWRVFTDPDGSSRGFWCCPMEGCDGKGFGFDIWPVDPNWSDPDGREMGWCDDDDDGEWDEESEEDIWDDEDDEDDPGDWLGESETSANGDAGTSDGSMSELPPIEEDDIPY